MKHIVFILIIEFITKGGSAVSNNATSSLQNQTSSSSAYLLCGFCDCIQTDCTLLSNPDIDCAENYSNTCEIPEYVSTNPNCNVACDCCISGECVQWFNYFCFIYRAYQFMSVIYFGVLIFGGMVLKRLATHFFLIVTLPNTRIVDWEGDSKVLRIRFSQIVSIKYVHEFDKRVSNHHGYETAIELFEAIHAKQSLAQFNLSYFFLIMFFFFATCGFVVYTALVLPSSPKMFSNIFWVINSCGFILIFLVVFGFGCIRAYRIQVLKLVFEFEQTYHCKVQVQSKARSFCFLFQRQKTHLPKNAQESANTLNDMISLRSERDGVATLRVVLGDKENKKAFSDFELY